MVLGRVMGTCLSVDLVLSLSLGVFAQGQERFNQDLVLVPQDQDVLYAATYDLPNLPVSDLLVHPRENDLVVGSWGRGLMIKDISPL